MMVQDGHVRILSCAWGCRLAGKCRANQAGSSIQRPMIIGVQDDVAHVSMISGSGSKSVEPQAQATRGCVVCGSTGSCSRDASTVSPHARHVQAGNGTPK